MSQPWKNRIVGYGEEAPDQLLAHPSNWRVHPKHQQDALSGVLAGVGIVQNVVANRRTGFLIDGHLRVMEALKAGQPSIPVTWVDLSEEEERLILATLDPLGAMAETDSAALDALLHEVSTDSPAVAAMLDALAQSVGVVPGLADAERDALLAQRNKEPAPNLPVDLIYTFAGGNGSCCIARAAGMAYGVRSTDRSCAYCKPIFIDNHYHKYDHQRHVAVVREHRPKYATVRDAMTRTQCDEAGIAYYELRQILEWAEEIAQYAEHVIVIPKYDCLDAIPDRYVLGYSVPTSYGGTPMPISAFRGHRVHLLGGEPRLQVEYWRELADDVVSIDNNYIQRKSQFGMVLTEQFEWVQLYDYGDMGSLPNPWHVCLAINCGRMMQLFRQQVPDNPVQTLEDE